MVSPAARRRAVKMSVQEGLGKAAAACRALGVSEIDLRSQRAIEPGEPARPRRSAGSERRASSLWLSTHYRANAAGKASRSTRNSGTDSERRRNQGEHKTTPHEAARDLDAERQRAERPGKFGAGTSSPTRLKTEAVFASLPCSTNTPGNAWRFILRGRSAPSMSSRWSKQP